MKRLVSILLVLVMVFSLCACGSKDEADTPQKQDPTQSTESVVDDKKDPSTSESTPDEETQPEENKDPWVVKSMEWPSFPQITYVQKNIGNTDVKHAVMVDPFKFDFDNAYQIISNNEFIKENYVIGKEHSERMEDAATYTDAGCLATYAVYDSIVGYYKDTYVPGEYNDEAFSFNFVRHTNDIESGYDYFSLSMSDIVVERTEFTPEEIKCFDGLQDKLLDILTGIVGEEYANYMIYAQKEDSSDYSYNIFKRCDPNGPEEGYSVKREIKGTDILFVLSAQIDPFKNSNKTFSGDHVSKYENFKYKIEDVLVDTRVGSLNPLQFDDFAKDYMELSTDEYIRTLPPANSMYVSELVVGNTTKYYFSSSWEGGLSEITGERPSIQINYTIWETDGAISDLDVSVYGSPRTLKTDDKDNIVKEAKAMLALLLPADFDLSHIVDSSNTTTKEADYTLFGIDCTIKTSAWASNSVTKGNYGSFSIDIDPK